MRDSWELIIDRWENDSVFREQIILAIIIGTIGLTFTLLEISARRAMLP